MSQHPIQTLEDGTRVYSNGTKYTPVSAERRKYRVRKPPVAGAVRYQGNWYAPLELRPVSAREWPRTRPDTDAYLHMTKPRKCRCEVCQRPEAQRWKDKWLAEQRQIRTASSPDSTS